jgi:hypothetical protein
VDQAGRPFPEEYPDDVEAHGVEVRLLLRQVPFGQGAYGCLLAGGDRFERVSVSRTPSQLDLDEDEGVFVAQDQVQLPEAGAVVAFDELVAPLRQVAQREAFAPRAGGAFAQGPTPA